MTIAAGSRVYEYGSFPCSGTGMQWTKEEMHAALKGDVAAILFGDKDAVEIASIFASVPETGFVQKNLNRILNIKSKVEDWRVGEAIAESYLVSHRSCYFPWSAYRDMKNKRSSLPGADLVGFSSGDCLVFGEVKTSGQAKYPPDVMYGQAGLKQQLANLRDNKDVRDTLFRYLAYRSKNASWECRFKTAGIRYLQNSSDVQLFGVLIRDVSPKAEDLRAQVQSLAQDRPTRTVIELLGIYLPKRSIQGIGSIVTAKRAGDTT